jgi:phosphoglycerol transferase MdoB-like AlkP superfamily enzyme
MEKVGAIGAYRQITEPGRLPVSVVFDSVSRFVRIGSQLQREADVATARDKEGGHPPAKAVCKDCPDLVIVHLESTFDPEILAEWKDEPGYLKRMATESPNPAIGGQLVVNVTGGGSWISEFEVLCGAHHKIFEDGGSFPHMYLARFMKSCFPAHLREQGYKTHAIYTTSPFFAAVGAGFRGYGIDSFSDPKAVGAPLSWQDQRDVHFVQALTRLLDQPSDHPRFVFVSTNSNHGPHGQGLFRTQFEGPFSSSRMSNPALADYVNRLNDTYRTMLGLEHDLSRRERPVAVLFYGDHQPSFRKTFNRTAASAGKRQFVTLYRMARNYGDPPPAAGPTLPIEAVTGRFLDFAGVPVPSAAIVARVLQAQACPSSQADCPPATKQSLRRLLMTAAQSADR